MILVTGGAGYIGSHTCVELLNAGYQVLILDNFSNSHPEVIKRIEMISGERITSVVGDIRNTGLLNHIFDSYPIEAVIHFAGLKAVGDSVLDPLAYYENNVSGTLSLLGVMAHKNIKKLIFSSSATVYGIPQELPLKEEHPLSVTNPYGRTKLMLEEILNDLFLSSPDWHISILRYFNPVGAHESGLIGENPKGTPSNLMPYVGQVAIGMRDMVRVWGGDYPTNDGTGVRDYIHVVDLALGHIKALQFLSKPQIFTVNLGTGRGFSVLEMVNAFEIVSGKDIHYEIFARREGDVAAAYSDPSRAENLLNWRAERGIDLMCRDQWNWQLNNPSGYESNVNESS